MLENAPEVDLSHAHGAFFALSRREQFVLESNRIGYLEEDNCAYRRIFLTITLEWKIFQTWYRGIMMRELPASLATTLWNGLREGIGGINYNEAPGMASTINDYLADPEGVPPNNNSSFIDSVQEIFSSAASGQEFHDALTRNERMAREVRYELGTLRLVYEVST